MVANGLLTNPMLFTGAKQTTLDCVQNWVDICFNSTLSVEDHDDLSELRDHTILEKPTNLTFQCFHHHLVFMLEKILSKAKRRIFNNYQYFSDVIGFLKDEFDVTPRLYELEDFKMNKILRLEYNTREVAETNGVLSYNYEETDGKHFKKKSKVFDDAENYGIGDIFIED